MDKKTRIIELWEQKKEVHFSYAEIAKTVVVNKSYVWRVIKDYKRNKERAF